MKHQLADLLNIPRLQSALDSLYIASKIPSAIIDNNGKVHTGSGWEDICTKFHRVHPEARKRCIESDLYITGHIHEANPSITYKCPHGLVDSATPIIIEGVHLGNVFTGQLFLEEPDLDYFRSQARAYGFDEGEYIDAVKKVPIVSEQAMQENLAFIAHLTGMLAEMGLKRTKEKEAERQLRESEERYRALFSRAGDGIFIMSPDGKLVDINESFARLHGYGTAELLRMNIKDLDTPETSQRFPARVARIMAGESLTFEVEHYHKDGHKFPLEVSASLISFGGESYIQSFHRDITDRKRVEDALRSSEEKYRLVVENANDAIVIAQDGIILYANSRFFDFIRASAEKIVGHSFIGLIHPDDREWVVGYHTMRMRGEQAPMIYEFRLVNNEGETLWVENSLVLTTWQGRPATLGFLRNITQQKQLETQLIQSQKMEAVGRLAGGIAHDFNNLLTVITGYVELILGKQGKEDPFHKEMMEIKNAADRTAELTRQLLAFSRKQILQPKIINLNDIVVNMEKILRRLIGEDIDLLTVLEKDATTVLVDPIQIEQVIINLAVNARDAMPDGGELVIQTKNVLLDDTFAREHPSVVQGPHVVLSMSDTGIGMSQGTMSHIFEPFFTTKETGKGTGLGLSTTYGIINQSKGHIVAESVQGSGTTFRIYLPKVEGGEPDSRKTRSNDAVGGEETILVVEDEPEVRELIREILVRKGYSVILAGGGDEAVLLSGGFKEPIHLLVTDVVMPGMNGRELAYRISAARQGIKVIFMSGYTDDVISHHGVLGDGIEFLEKPFSPETLINKVREVLGAR
jgi:PAS domain S-box-containing protein